MDIKEHYRVFNKTVAFDGYWIVVEVYLQGEDLIIRCFGGDKPHIGAIAIAIPRISMANSLRTSATTSVYALTGHKDDVIATSMARKIAAAVNKLVVAIVGIHIEGITEVKINKLIEIIDSLEQEMISAINRSYR